MGVLVPKSAFSAADNTNEHFGLTLCEIFPKVGQIWSLLLIDMVLNQCSITPKAIQSSHPPSFLLKTMVWSSLLLLTYKEKGSF